MSNEPVLPRSPNAKHAATDGERTSLILVLHYHLSCHGGVICTGPDCRTAHRPNQSSGIMGAVDSGTGALWQQLLCNCCSACGDDGAFQDDGEATIWFEPVDPGEQERTDEDDQRNMKGG
jgi:hypothetical protein